MFFSFFSAYAVYGAVDGFDRILAQNYAKNGAKMSWKMTVPLQAL